MRQNRNLTLFYTEYMENMLVDKKTRALVSEYVPPADTLTALADLFSLLSDAGRLKIVSALSISSLCVSDLSALIGMNQTTRRTSSPRSAARTSSTSAARAKSPFIT